MCRIAVHFLVLLLVLDGERLSAYTDNSPPNVLLIVTDEHNFRTLGCYREQMPKEQAEMWGRNVVVPTPNIDRLANEGVICTRAYATSPVCSPCRAAMFTGRYPHMTGVPANDKVLDRSIPTIADRLNDAGYRTAYIGKWHLGGTGKPEWSPKVDGGFQFKKFMFNRGHWKKFGIENGNPIVAAQRKGEPSYAVDGADETSFSTDWLTDRAIEFMADKEATKPFFTVVSYPDPHGPNSVRAPYDQRFNDMQFVAPRTYQTGAVAPKWLGAAKQHPIFRGPEMAQYFGMVQCIDDNIGRILARLKETGQLKNTLVIMTSDHGDLCYEHDRLNKGNPFEGSARVPMIFRLPEHIKAKQVFTQPIGTVDMTPTIMGLLNLPNDPNDQGRNLSANLINVAASETSDTKPPLTFLRNSGMAAGWVAAVDDRYKLVISVNDDPWLFDREQDPDELLNLYLRPGTEGVAERLGKALREYGITNQDPHLGHAKISASLDRVLGKSKTKIDEPSTSGTSKEKISFSPSTVASQTVPKSNTRSESDSMFQSNWQGTRRWIGPRWWANPMTDWSMKENQVVADANKDRTLCLLTQDLNGAGQKFEMRVVVELLGEAPDKNRAAGFRIGRHGGIDDYRHALVSANNWIDATIRENGKISLGNVVSKEALSLGQGPVTLTLRGERSGESMLLTLTAGNGFAEITTAETRPIRECLGGVSLLSDGPPKKAGDPSQKQFAFRDFELSGDLAKEHPDRTFGPILWSQYTLSEKRLRLQAQFAPLGPQQAQPAELWVAGATGEPMWKKIATADMEKLSRTVTFTVDDWSSDLSKRYQVRFNWRKQEYVWDGIVRREPKPLEPLKLACFSCDNGYLFPIPAMVSQVLQQDPDMVYFAGDQIYESYGGFGTAFDADTETAMLDYLRKYYQFGWTWRDILRDRPSVILPDDHDVFQGNLWGHGGRKLPGEKMNDWAMGGYRMPGEWVNAIEKTIVGHLPDPAVDMTLPIGIQPYFTKMNYGGIGFVILEDRKFKTGPLSIPEDKRKEGIDADLLGEVQETFLKQWAADWEGQEMKCALSQTIFCSAATHANYDLKRAPYFYDSGAWPKAARNRAVRILGDCNALSIHGDQHLGVLLRQGVDDFDDAGFAFMVPGTANGFPRAWWPGVNKGLPQPGQDFTGKFRDDAGHPINVLAVGNPEPGSNLLPKTTDPMEVGFRKGSGYGMVEFDKTNGTAKISMYRLGNVGEMFTGFPVTVKIGGQPSFATPQKPVN